MSVEPRQDRSAWRRAHRRQRVDAPAARFEGDAEDARQWLIERGLLPA